MKQLSWILNVILLIAVIHLYYVHFSGHSGSSGSKDIIVSAKDLKPSTIVYVNSDSLLNNYEFYKKLKKELEDKNKRSEDELNSKLSAFEREVAAYQQKASTSMREPATEEALQKKQESLMKRREELGIQLADHQQKLTEELHKNLSDYLKRYAKNTNYKYILGYTKGGGILYANDSLDITGKVIEGLNKEYTEKKDSKE
jgi:outer membrane protein